MTSAVTTSSVARTGPAVRDALQPWPLDCQQFEVELAAAAQGIRDTWDLAPAQAVIAHWHRIAVARTQLLSASEREAVRQARSGDYAGLYQQNAEGDFDRIG